MGSGSDREGGDAPNPAHHGARWHEGQDTRRAGYTHTRGESNAGVEIPMMALPNDSAIASLPAIMPSSCIYTYRASPDADS